VAENIAAGHTSAADALGAWMHSSDHRRNLLDPRLTHIGIGMALGSWEHRYKVLWVQSFGRQEVWPSQGAESPGELGPSPAQPHPRPLSHLPRPQPGEGRHHPPSDFKALERMGGVPPSPGGWVGDGRGGAGG
jgi:hypothetical protein